MGSIDYKTLYEEKCKELEAIKATIVGTGEITITKTYYDTNSYPRTPYVYEFSLVGGDYWTRHYVCSDKPLPLTLGKCKIHFESNMK